MSINKWLDKEDVVQVYNGILLHHFKNEIMPFAPTCRVLEIIILNKSERQIMISLNVESKIWHKWTYLKSRNRLPREQTVIARRNRGGRGMDWELVVPKCKWLHSEWINNKVLMYSTGNYNTNPVINHNEKEYTKECLYVYS